MSGNRVVAIIIVALIHIALGYALITGLAYEAATKVLERVTTIDIEEPPPPPEPEEEPPPPEPQPDTAPPPPVAPPPPMNISTRPPDIRTQVTIPPPAPPAVRIPPPAPIAPPRAAPPPPPPPPPPSQARPASRRNANSWVGRIQGDYPSRAVRQNEEGTVTMRITVGTDGRVSACSVTGSSGSSALDDAACRGMQRYARYEPALNAAGNPISTTLSEAIRYELPE
ncbi:TonB family protein [Qipengyuania sp. DY56-A-20]|uniref:TonB family protein n=1 Tax=Qipengyuania benthica TaxID=3067651 RepID=A0ABT9HBE6_9SPHN|nr:energy transducer TonB [Qipengyuania sp. DY56-A-20]MDP4540648.1 TonB family protein [Qipengyuania sp. DY56-A-20]